jgi:2-octaprenylphenol hydroxylase
MQMDDETFSQELSSSFEYTLGKVLQVDQRISFPLRQRHAENYIKPGIVLVGDAAHTIHPLAGQGVNLGFLDAATLVEEVERGLSRGLPIGSLSVLRRYQRRRKASNLGMMAVMEGFKRLFARKELPLRWLRNTGMSAVNTLPLLKNRIMRSAMGIDQI